VSAIVVEGLHKNFGGVRALDGLDFSIKRGAVFGFLGPNGAGKTTTLRILAGLAKPTAGSAWIEGQQVGPESPGRGILGYLPEEPGFYPWLTAREFLVDLMGGLCGLSHREANSRADELLEMLGLQDDADRRVGGFSRGMKQRLGLAQALLNRPRVLLLDEPVSALDPVGRHDILALIESLKGETTVLMSTHILADVERICDAIGIIDHGKLVAFGERQELLQRFAVPVTEMIFDAAEEDVEVWGASLRDLDFVKDVFSKGNVLRITLDGSEAGKKMLQDHILGSGMMLQSYRQTRPQLEDVFLRLIGGER
jgi:ABC-2 type transport system ATP-binding protein